MLSSQMVSQPLLLRARPTPLCALMIFSDTSSLQGLTSSSGLHLTGAGYQIVYEELTEVIRSQVPELVPETLPMILPEWKKITLDMKF